MGTMFDTIAKGATLDESMDEPMSMVSGRNKISTINTIEQILELIETSSNILVLTGAGISVSAGIPDFRSENGLYSTLKETFNLTDPTAMFDIKYFIKNPSLFYSFSSEILPGFNNKQIKYYPTSTHYFIKSLELKSKLLRNYTQNIDTLEMRAGIKNIITCHGSYNTASCINCQFQIHGSHIQNHIFNSEIPFCPYCCPHKSDLKHLLNISSHTLHKHKPIIVSNQHGNVLFVRLPNVLCEMEYLQQCPILFSFDQCILQTAIYNANEISLDEEKDTHVLNSRYKILALKSNDMNVLKLIKDAIMQWLQIDVMEHSFGVIKPDIVFFNESLSDNYHKMLQNDIKKCDLLLAIGTSLKVEPVCSIPSLIPEHIPAVLINREVTGFPSQFDVNFLGNCDDICNTLMYKLNWQLLQPKILQNCDEINEQHEIQTIDSYVTNPMLIEYEYIAPNFYLFPNGKLPPPSYVFPENELTNIPTTLTDVDMVVADIIKEEQQQAGVIVTEINLNNCSANSKELLVYGYVRSCVKVLSISFLETLLEYYTVIPKLSNCFFMYGPLRDDINMVNDRGNDAWCEGCDGYLGIVYGYKLFGNPSDAFPFAKRTNNKNDYIIGRIVCFKDDLEFECQLNWADGIKGYDPNAGNRNENMFVRGNVKCYIFDDLNEKELVKMGYYNRDVIIDFTNESKIKQYATMYYHPNTPHVKTETPHSDWIKRFAKKKLFT